MLRGWEACTYLVSNTVIPDTKEFWVPDPSPSDSSFGVAGGVPMNVPISPFSRHQKPQTPDFL